jgi:hypothetical protein
MLSHTTLNANRTSSADPTEGGGIENEADGVAVLIDSPVTNNTAFSGNLPATRGGIAKVLGVARSFVYEHAEELGAYRLGSGPRARMRFDLDEVKRRIGATPCQASRESRGTDAVSEVGKRPRRRRRSGTNVELLPIRGRSEAA